MVKLCLFFFFYIRILFFFSGWAPPPPPIFSVGGECGRGWMISVTGNFGPVIVAVLRPILEGGRCERRYIGKAVVDFFFLKPVLSSPALFSFFFS